MEFRLKIISDIDTDNTVNAPTKYHRENINI